jgi:hypothetical protein
VERLFDADVDAVGLDLASYLGGDVGCFWIGGNT